MRQPLFDFDLKRVSREHYITGKAAINFPHPESTTGGWHFLSYFDREAGVVKVSLAGIHYPDTTDFFGDAGVTDVTDQLFQRGWSEGGRKLFMADHYRAVADMIAKWALSETKHCSVEIDEWFPASNDKKRLVDLITNGMPKICNRAKSEKAEIWLNSQTSRSICR
ncbi:hypothetical protein HX807_07230 [Pseudomonas sp. D8002]|uniref:hypothetical protein n=1 Tax=Pseudomonas TaxID=286 RepID=UPI0008DAB2F6|nr:MULTISPECIES: hypothetical protein [Pseudomonas]NMY99734.1 hypothetical protein [Pseudomonas proteolytica]NWA88389.1 hypothetical protein [Pseudomonas sp. D8002]OHW41371.1 hypothetical protein BHC62_12285 [Pseudomonas sp. 06C 126]